MVCRHRRVNSVAQVTGRVWGLEEMSSRPVGVLADCGDAAIWKETWAGPCLRAERLLGRVRQSQGALWEEGANRLPHRWVPLTCAPAPTEGAAPQLPQWARTLEDQICPSLAPVLARQGPRTP